jgi:hypothetical protein
MGRTLDQMTYFVKEKNLVVWSGAMAGYETRRLAGLSSTAHDHVRMDTDRRIAHLTCCGAALLAMRFLAFGWRVKLPWGCSNAGDVLVNLDMDGHLI